MEYQKFTNLLGTTLDEVPRFITKKWVEFHDQSGDANDRYKLNQQIRFKTSMLRSYLCDISDAYIVVKDDITLTKTNGRGIIDIRNRFLAFRNNAPFTSSIPKIIIVLNKNAKDLDIVMLKYNLLERTKDYRKSTENLWNYYRDNSNNPLLNDDDPTNISYNAAPKTNSESFKYKSILQEKHQMQIKKTVKTMSKETQRLKTILKLLFH